VEKPPVESCCKGLSEIGDDTSSESTPQLLGTAI